MILNGWNGVCVEPGSESFAKLQELHKDKSNVQLFNIGIAEESREYDFYSSGEHLGYGDSELLSSLIESETKKWIKEQFTKTTINCLTFADFMLQSRYNKFELITIDTEGMDWVILQQMNLKELECEFLIIENNRVDENKFVDYCTQFDLKLINKNYENLLFSL